MAQENKNARLPKTGAGPFFTTVMKMQTAIRKQSKLSASIFFYTFYINSSACHFYAYSMLIYNKKFIQNFYS